MNRKFCKGCLKDVTETGICECGQHAIKTTGLEERSHTISGTLEAGEFNMIVTPLNTNKSTTSNAHCYINELADIMSKGFDIGNVEDLMNNWTEMIEYQANWFKQYAEHYFTKEEAERHYENIARMFDDIKNHQLLFKATFIKNRVDPKNIKI